MALTKLNNKAVANVTSLPVALGDMVLVSSATASSSASIEFTLGNYKEYQFYFVNIKPQTDSVAFQMNFSTDNGSNYNVVKTTTLFRSSHDEADTFTQFGYNTNEDLAQSTSYQNLVYGIGNGSDECIGGIFQLYNPSSNTYVKHFLSNCSNYFASNGNNQMLVAGYANSVSPLTNIRFQMASGNIDAGTILMYGIN